MSCTAVDDSTGVCASCGKSSGGEGGAVKLKGCACRLVKYCSVDCQKAHRHQHKMACKTRTAELEDEKLYNQGLERPDGDFCSICTLPIPLPMGDHSVVSYCCMKQVCNGCHFAAQKKGMQGCPFCRTPLPDKDADKLAMIRARVKKKDPVAIEFLGDVYRQGRYGVQKDIQKAIDLYTEAAELGLIRALYTLGLMHDNGEGVRQDEAKGAEFYKKAAMQGHAEGRHNLGFYEAGVKGNSDRAVKHCLISAKMGLKNSTGLIKQLFVMGLATKEQYTEALKGYQDAVEETKSHDRDEAKRLDIISIIRRQSHLY